MMQNNNEISQTCPPGQTNVIESIANPMFHTEPCSVLWKYITQDFNGTELSIMLQNQFGQ
mgnify:CR=1 FL=1